MCGLLQLKAESVQGSGILGFAPSLLVHYRVMTKGSLANVGWFKGVSTVRIRFRASAEAGL